MEQIAMSVAETAEALGLGQTLTRELIANGELRSVRVKRRVIVTVNEIHSYLERLAATQAAAEQR